MVDDLDKVLSFGSVNCAAHRSAGSLVRAIKNALNVGVPRSISTALFPRRSHGGAKARSFRCGVHAVKSVPTMPALKCCSSDRLAKDVLGCSYPSNAVTLRRQAIAALQHKVSARLGDQRCAQLRRYVGECMLVAGFGQAPSFNAAVGAMAPKGGSPVTESASETSAALALTTSCSGPSLAATRRASCAPDYCVSAGHALSHHCAAAELDRYSARSRMH
jgi:hypothetical protein